MLCCRLIKFVRKYSNCVSLRSHTFWFDVRWVVFVHRLPWFVEPYLWQINFGHCTYTITDCCILNALDVLVTYIYIHIYLLTHLPIRLHTLKNEFWKHWFCMKSVFKIYSSKFRHNKVIYDSLNAWFNYQQIFTKNYPFICI